MLAAEDKPNAWLEACDSKVFSQRGEDGRLAKILEVIGVREGWCVEFGAWDGVFNSNTWNLVKNHGFRAVLIEGSPAKFPELQRNTQGHPVTAINAYVEFAGERSLDRLLATTAIPADFAVLSIDIDGNDYHVWASLTAYRPRVVIVEFNPTIPDEVDFVQAADPRINHGASISALVRLGREKGYELVSANLNNAFFVERSLHPRFGIADNSVHALRTDRSRVTHLFSGYDGTVFVRGFAELDLHRLPFSEPRMQLLPRWLRGYDDAPTPLGKAKRFLRRIYKSLRKRNIL